MFGIISDSFFVPLASPNKLMYWECICKLFSIMDNQLSFGVEQYRSSWCCAHADFGKYESADHRT